MNILFSTIGRRGYLVDYFREVCPEGSLFIGTSDRHSSESEYTSGLYYCDKKYIVSSIKDEETYVSDLINICKQDNIKFILSLYDFDSYILSKYENRFKDIKVKLLISSYSVNELAFDKIKTYNFLKTNNFNTPMTYSNDEFVRLPDSLINYPVIIKPRFGFGSSGLHIAKNRNEVNFFVEYSQNEVIIQEVLAGDEYSFDILSDWDGTVITAACKRKLKMRAGETDQGYSIYDEKLLEYAYKLGSAIKGCGPIDIDFFIVDDEVYILEINPRFGGGYPITHLSGLNFPKIIVEMIENKLSADFSRYRKYKHGIVGIKDYKLIKETLMEKR